jgi:hypothetical protein
MTAERPVEIAHIHPGPAPFAVKKLAKDWMYDVASIGYRLDGFVLAGVAIRDRRPAECDAFRLCPLDPGGS